MDFTLKIWRQDNARIKGRFKTYPLKDVSPEMSFLEMLDYLNTELIQAGENPVTFEHDCREGICGTCGLYINGYAHGPASLTTTCELRMYKFKDGDRIVIEPWRSRAFPIIKDLVVDRTAFDKIMQAGGFISANAGAAPDANAMPIPTPKSDAAFDAATCVGCGACVAACKNSSAMLFVSAKISQFTFLPQGRMEAKERVQKMVSRMDELGFGNCTNTGACEARCPKGINLTHIARMNREFLGAKIGAQLVGA